MFNNIPTSTKSGCSIFGAPFEQLLVGDGLHPSLQGLIEMLSRPLPSDAFNTPHWDPNIISLQETLDENGMNTFKNVPIQAVGGLLVRFYKMLPVPIVPHHYNGNLLHIATIQNQKLQCDQLRLFFTKLPNANKRVLFSLLNCLNATRLDPNVTSRLFGSALARIGQEGESSQPVDSILSVAIIQASYLSLATQQPIHTSNNTPNQNEKLQEARVMYDFSATSQNMLTLCVGDIVSLHNAYPDDWLEGTLNGNTGFLPSGFVELVPMNMSQLQFSQQPQQPFKTSPVFQNQQNNSAQLPSPQLNGQFQPTQPNDLYRSNSQQGFQSSPQTNQFRLPPQQSPIQLQSLQKDPFQPPSPLNQLQSSPSQNGSRVSPQQQKQNPLFSPNNQFRPPSLQNSSIDGDKSHMRFNSFGGQPKSASQGASGLYVNNTIPSEQSVMSAPFPPNAQRNDNRSFNRSSNGFESAANSVISQNELKLASNTLRSSSAMNSSDDSIKDDSGCSEIRVVVVGAGGVGKSALTISFVQNYFVEVYDPTIEDSYRKQITVDGKTCLLNILDTAGQEEYSAMRDLYMRKGDGFILVFAVNLRESLDELIDLRDKAMQTKDADSLPMAVAANKCDLRDEFQISRQEAETFVKTKINCPLVFTSAKERTNVEELFQVVVTLIRQAKKPTVIGKPKRKLCRIL